MLSLSFSIVILVKKNKKKTVEVKENNDTIETCCIRKNVNMYMNYEYTYKNAAVSIQSFSLILF